MSTRPEAIIFDLLAARLSALALSLPLPIAWPMRELKPPQSANCLEVAHLPNGARSPFLSRGSPIIHQGLLQVTVVQDLGKSPGITPILEVAGAVAAHFPPGLKLFAPSLYVVAGTPALATPFKDGDSLRAPVTVPWTAVA
ncbi:phage tail terminator-like protein [Xanthobacteraceae bacterium A53D]